MNDIVTSEPETEITATLGLDGAGRRRGRWRRLALVGGVLGLALVAGYLYLGRGNSAAAVRYSTEAVHRGPLTVTVTATGTVEPTNMVEVSSELSGKIKDVKVDYNDHVKAGQILAELDTDKLSAQVDSARANVAVKEAQLVQAQATLAETKRNLDRIQPLAQRNFSTTADLDTARAAYERAQAGVDVAKADVRVAQANLKLGETDLGKACICSPIDGVVLTRAVDPGQTVAASLQAPILFTLAEDLSSMQLEVDIDEADVGKVREGQSATFTVEAFQDRTFGAKVTELRYAPKSVDGVVTYTAVLSLDNSELLLRPGMTATADVVVDHMDDALLVPNAALRYAPPQAAQPQRRGGGGGIMRAILPIPRGRTEVPKVAETPDGMRTVWVLRDGAPVGVSVKTGASDDSWTRIVEGDLHEGDAVIVDAETAR